MYLTDKQIKSVAKLMALEIPEIIHRCYENDRECLGIHETVEEALIRKMHRVPEDAALPTILGSMIQCGSTPYKLMEFNALDKELTAKFDQICENIANDKFLPGITMHTKLEVLEFITDLDPKKVNECVNGNEDDIKLILRTIYHIIESKINDFEL